MGGLQCAGPPRVALVSACRSRAPTPRRGGSLSSRAAKAGWGAPCWVGSAGQMKIRIGDRLPAPPMEESSQKLIIGRVYFVA